MQFKPILFSTEMVKAILAGNKTMTRRTKNLDVINNSPDKWDLDFYERNFNERLCAVFSEAEIGIEKYCIPSPYGEVGDVLWVRESWCKATVYQSNNPVELFSYKATRKLPIETKWKPCIHMPKTACRIFLKIKSIRVERLHDISEADAIAEGITLENLSGDWDHPPTAEFQNLWKKINGSDSWDANPWVWVIEFEQISKPQNFN